MDIFVNGIQPAFITPKGSTKYKVKDKKCKKLHRNEMKDVQLLMLAFCMQILGRFQFTDALCLYVIFSYFSYQIFLSFIISFVIIAYLTLLQEYILCTFVSMGAGVVLTV